VSEDIRRRTRTAIKQLSELQLSEADLERATTIQDVLSTVEELLQKYDILVQHEEALKLTTESPFILADPASDRERWMSEGWNQAFAGIHKILTDNQEGMPNE